MSTTTKIPACVLAVLACVSFVACGGESDRGAHAAGQALEEKKPEPKQTVKRGTIYNWKDHHNTTVQWHPRRHARQTLFNRYMTHLSGVTFQVQGPMTQASDTATVTLLDGCGKKLVAGSVMFDNTGLTAPGSLKTLTVLLNVPLKRGQYYQLEFGANWGASPAGAALVLNTDTFVDGRFYDNMLSRIDFPEKKRDVKFYATGKVDTSKAPSLKTNVMCPARCKVVREKKSDPSWWASGSPQYDFNVVVTEKPDGTGGSFWGDYDPSTSQIKSGLLEKVEQLFMHSDSVAGVAPFDEWLGDDYDKQMNIYVAITSPTEDPWSYAALQYCANVDAHVQLVTNGVGYGPQPYGGATGRFMGQVARPEINTYEWQLWPDKPGSGASNYFTLVHEVFGHGVGALADEYILSTTSVASEPNQSFAANSVPLTCEGLCRSARPVKWLVEQMAKDPDGVCWSKTTQASCVSPGGNAQCRWIGDLPTIPYWGSYKCIPTNVSQYDIGVDCRPNTSCMPLAPKGTSGKAYMGMAQAGTSIMQSGHGVSHPGFGGAVEEFFRDLMQCVFPSTCHRYPQARCDKFEAKWGSDGNSWWNFVEHGNGCEGTTYRRR